MIGNQDMVGILTLRMRRCMWVSSWEGRCMERDHSQPIQGRSMKGTGEMERERESRMLPSVSAKMKSMISSPHSNLKRDP